MWGGGGGGVVVSEHSSQFSRSSFTTSSKSQTEEEYEIPCEGDLLVVRRMLGKLQIKGKIFLYKVPY